MLGIRDAVLEMQRKEEYERALKRTPPNSKPFRDEITKLRCALSDIESLAETLQEAQEMATKALTGSDHWHNT